LAAIAPALLTAALATPSGIALWIAMPGANPASANTPTLLPAGLTTFADWCNQRNRLPQDAQVTVNELLTIAKTTDCPLAQQRLNQTPAFVLRGSHIADLRPIALFPHLRSLTLHEHLITDLTPLTALRNLETLDLTGRLNDRPLRPNPSPAAKPKGLDPSPKNPKFPDNPHTKQLPGWIPYEFGRPGSVGQISDLRPLNDLRNLRELHLNGNNITDIRPLSLLPNLQKLSLSQNPLRNLDVLRDMSQLTALDVSGLPSRDLGAIVELRGLTQLKLTDSGLTDLRLIRNLKQLQDLDLRRNRLQNIDFLAPFQSLQILHLEHNQIRDISPLASLTNLRKLDVRDNQIRDFSIIDSFRQLTELIAWDNPVEIQGCPNRDPVWSYKICKYRLTEVRG
jgi:internalin A